MTDPLIWKPIEQKVNTKVKEVFSELQKIWTDIGYSNETQEIYYEQAFNHINDLLNEMMAEAQTKEQLLLESIKDLCKQMSTLHTELHLNMTLKTYDEVPLNKVEQLLRADLQDLEQMKKERRMALKELLAREQNICKRLGVKTLSIGEDVLPSEQTIENFKSHIQDQEKEKNRLENIFTAIRCIIVKMMNNLDLVPATSFEHLVCNNPEDFVLSTSNITKLKELKDQLKMQTEETRCRVEKMKEELSALWKYLDEPDHACRSFLDRHPDHNTTTANALSTEIKRCKEKRKENILKYVTQMRFELVGLWDQCRYCEAERNLFAPFHSDMFTEDLLTLHELEVKRLRKFYNDNRTIFELLEQHETLLNKIKELLKRTNNPDRFYNRGGQLLMEEKERKVIHKKLPKIEAELRHLINEYESMHNQTFTIYGMSLETVLAESWESLNIEKETIQRARREAKDKSVKKSPLNSSRKTPGASQLSLHRGPILGMSKRKLFTPSPNTSSAKRRNKNGDKCRTPVIASKVRRSGRIPKIVIQKAHRSSKESERDKVSSDNSITDMYNQFQSCITSREESGRIPKIVIQKAHRSSKESERDKVSSDNSITDARNQFLSYIMSREESDRIPKIVIQKAHISSKESERDKVSSDNSITDARNEFLSYIMSREEWQSSLLCVPQQILKSANKITNTVKTPVRTPAKPLRKIFPIVSTPTRGSARKTPQYSPRNINTPKLTTPPNNLPFMF